MRRSWIEKDSIVRDVSAAALRALSVNDEIVVRRGGVARSIASGVTLPDLPEKLSLAALRVARGEVDAVALRLRYCDEATYSRYLPGPASARLIYSALEQIRVEALVSHCLVGVRADLAALQTSIHTTRSAAHTPEAGFDESDAVLRFARFRLGAPVSSDAKVFDEASATIHQEAIAQIESLVPLLHDQALFAVQTRSLIESLGLVENRALSIDRDRKSATEQDSRSHRSASGDSTATEWDPLRGPETQRAKALALDPRPSRLGSLADRAPYHAYTTEFDTIVRPEKLCDACELVGLRRLLDDAMPAELYATRRLAHRLQRHLIAQQTRSWTFDLEEGLLDSSRLSRVVADP